MDERVPSLFWNPCGMGRLHAGEPRAAYGLEFDRAAGWRVDWSVPAEIWSVGLTDWACDVLPAWLRLRGQEWAYMVRLGSEEPEMTDAELVAKLRAWDGLPLRLRELSDSMLARVVRGGVRRRLHARWALQDAAAATRLIFALGLENEVAAMDNPPPLRRRTR